ncbi:response regulator [Amycolatopsis sp. NPDC058278]|uniref:response regulator n=1 Tax=Amycolatopsis sp. NPDC058278 TaxID=3346417 RepID=UPI0036DF3A23
MCAFVLVAEDDVKQAELLRSYLRREAHSVLVVHDGREAVDQAALRHPALLVLDGMTPGLDGLEVVRSLRRDSDLPVLLVTARSTCHPGPRAAASPSIE